MAYTETGKNHINLYLSGKATNVATHIVLGIDFLSTGHGPPLTSDRYLGAFESARIQIDNRSSIGHEIVFASSYNSTRVPMLLSNMMGLVYQEPGLSTRERIRKNVYNDFNGGWTGSVELTDETTPIAWPDASGGMILANNTTAIAGGVLGLSSYRGEDFLSIPVFFYGVEPTTTPTPASLRATFHYLNSSGVATTYQLSDAIISTAANTYRFLNGSPVGGQGVPVTAAGLASPRPTVWQRRLDAGTGSADFLAHLDTIFQVDLTWTCTSNCMLYVGSPQITPDFASDTSNIMVAWGALDGPVAHSGQGYMAMEYRITGL